MPAVYNLACLQVGELFAYLLEEQVGGHWPEGGFELRLNALEGVDRGLGLLVPGRLEAGRQGSAMGRYSTVVQVKYSNFHVLMFTLHTFYEYFCKAF